VRSLFTFKERTTLSLISPFLFFLSQARSRTLPPLSTPSSDVFRDPSISRWREAIVFQSDVRSLADRVEFGFVPRTLSPVRVPPKMQSTSSFSSSLSLSLQILFRPLIRSLVFFFLSSRMIGLTSQKYPRPVRIRDGSAQSILQCLVPSFLRLLPDLSLRKGGDPPPPQCPLFSSAQTSVRGIFPVAVFFLTPPSPSDAECTMLFVLIPLLQSCPFSFPLMYFFALKHCFYEVFSFP